MHLATYRLHEPPRVDVADLARIGRLRRQVWKEEGALSDDAYPMGIWTDALDKTGVHWLVEDGRGALVAAGRLNLHDRRGDVRDAEMWAQRSEPLPEPVAYASRLVVSAAARGCGLATLIHRKRIAAARRAGARIVLATASAANVRILAPLGFVASPSVAAKVEADRPGIAFHAMELLL